MTEERLEKTLSIRMTREMRKRIDSEARKLGIKSGTYGLRLLKCALDRGSQGVDTVDEQRANNIYKAYKENESTLNASLEDRVGGLESQVEERQGLVDDGQSMRAAISTIDAAVERAVRGDVDNAYQVVDKRVQEVIQQQLSKQGQMIEAVGKLEERIAAVESSQMLNEMLGRLAEIDKRVAGLEEQGRNLQESVDDSASSKVEVGAGVSNKEKALESGLDGDVDKSEQIVDKSVQKRIQQRVDEPLSIVNEVGEEKIEDRQQGERMEGAREAVVRSEANIAELKRLVPEAEAVSAALETGLSGLQLAKRLKASRGTVRNHRNRGTLGDWSQKQDPEGIAWDYSVESEKYYPVIERKE